MARVLVFEVSRGLLFSAAVCAPASVLVALIVDRSNESMTLVGCALFVIVLSIRWWPVENISSHVEHAMCAMHQCHPASFAESAMHGPLGGSSVFEWSDAESKNKLMRRRHARSD